LEYDKALESHKKEREALKTILDFKMKNKIAEITKHLTNEARLHTILPY